MTRSRAIHKGEFLGAAATGKELILPPECWHMDFDEQGKVLELGFCTADRAQGNTGSLWCWQAFAIPRVSSLTRRVGNFDCSKRFPCWPSDCSNQKNE